MSESLGEAFPKAQARLRAALQHGREIGPAGTFYCAVIEDLLARADRALREQDLVKMINVFKEMQEMQEIQE